MIDLILLPGSLGVSSHLRPLGALLEDSCRLHYLELSGHGGRPLPDALSVQAMAADILLQMDERDLKSAHVLGYSFGGYVALYLAHVAPDRILGVCNIASKVIMDERAVRRGRMWARDQYLAKPGSPIRAQLEAEHPGIDLQRLVKMLAALYKDMGENPPLRGRDFRMLKPPCLTICGDRDPMVPWSEAAGLALRIPRSHCFTFAGRAHPFDELPLALVGAVIKGWLRLQQGRSPD